MTQERVSFAAGVDFDAAIDQAIAIVMREGVVVLDDLIDPALIAQVRGEVEAACPDMTRVDRERNYGPYPGRHVVPLTIEGTLAEKEILAPSVVRKIAKRLLEPTFHLQSLGLLVSAPGAPDQKAHADGQLFPRERLDRLLPPFALSFSLPLVAMDAVSGTTAFWRRSHRKPEIDGAHDFAPILQPGSGLLWDYRTIHSGLANRGDVPRPILFSVFCREWWREMIPDEATRYEPLVMTRAVRDGLSPGLLRVTNRARIAD